MTGPVLDPVAMRAEEEAQAPTGKPAVRAVEDSVADGVPVRIYTPSDEATGVLVYLHGGAFFLGSLDTHDHVARNLAVATGRRVVSVGYRLAPENDFPAGLLDCYGVVRWAAGQRSTGQRSTGQGSSVAVVGDSSGGNLVAAVAALAHDDDLDLVSHQVLLYPSLDLDFDESRYPSLVENAVGHGLETAGLKPFNAFYLGSGADAADPRVSPIKRQNLSGLPPALVITAEFDPLRDEGELYGRRLAEAGVTATVSRYDGVGHGFVQFAPDVPQTVRAYREIAEFLA